MASLQLSAAVDILRLRECDSNVSSWFTTPHRCASVHGSGCSGPLRGPAGVTKLLGVIIANGLSSENRVFATLLGAHDDQYDARVLMHQRTGDTAADRFAELSGCTTAGMDTGWRPSPYLRRGNPMRASVAVRYARSMNALTEDARRFAPDVVYSSQQHVDCRAATRIADRIEIPQIIHLHYNVGPWLRRIVLKQLRSADHVVAVSEFIRKQAISHGVAEDRVTTIHNAVAPFPPPDARRTESMRAELGLPTDVFTFGMVSRIDKFKGHLDAIDAFERFAVSHRDARLVIVGSGRIVGQVRARVERSPISDQILLTGFRTDVPDLLPVFDALVHPAIEDPCPLAVLEAMAAGLPVVGYDDGGVSELVIDGLTGALVDRRAIGQLSEAMHARYTDHEGSRRLGSAGRHRLTTWFTPQRAGRQFADIMMSYD